MEDFLREARRIAGRLQAGAKVLEVAPGPGYFAVELAKLGDFRVAGLDVSRTLVDIAGKNARAAGVNIDFQLGNASAMPFDDESFDFVYCSAAFKNFSEPIRALDEIHRVLRTGCEAVIVDLWKDASMHEVDAYIRGSGRSRLDAWMTRWTFRHVLLKRAYGAEEFLQLGKLSRFGRCQTKTSGISLEVSVTKNAETEGRDNKVIANSADLGGLSWKPM